MTFNLCRSRPIDAADARDDLEERLLLQASRGSLASKHSNPQRIGCPSRDFLLKLADHSMSLDELKPWTAHLSSCGECFREFQSLNQSPNPVLSGLWNVLRRLAQIFHEINNVQLCSQHRPCKAVAHPS